MYKKHSETTYKNGDVKPAKIFTAKAKTHILYKKTAGDVSTDVSSINIGR